MKPAPVTVRAACLDEAPPPLPKLELAPCTLAPDGVAACPPIPADAEKAIEGYMRRVSGWAAEAWQRCRAVAP